MTGCFQRNTSCNDIKTINGFKFLHEGPEGSEVSVYDDQIVIAHAELASMSFKFTSKVRSMDQHAVITTACRDLKVKCIVPEGKGFIREFCLDYKITEKMLPSGSPTPCNLIFGVSFGGVVALIVVLGIIGVLCYKTQLGTATASWFRSLLSCARPGTFQAKQERAGPGEEPSVSDSHEAVSEQDNTLEIVRVDSLDRSLNDEESQLPENGNTMTPEISRATNHRAMHRNLGDDPGGVNDNKGKDVSREMLNGWTRGDCDEDDEDEGRALLLRQRAAIRGSDMTAEAAALVNKRDFEPGQVSRCSTAPDTDVESTFNMNYTLE